MSAEKTEPPSKAARRKASGKAATRRSPASAAKTADKTAAKPATKTNGAAPAISGEIGDALANERGARHDPGTQLTSVDADIASVEQAPATAQTQSPAYRLAFIDPDFMRRDELRPVRLQLELLKPEMILEQRGVRSTVIMFGGARIPEPGGKARAKTKKAREALEAASKYYDEARAFAQLVSLHSRKTYGHEFVIATGGGPGIMEAGNRGAADVGAHSIGLGIVLRHEETPNAYVTPDLCFNFHYFAIRKMHFLMRAKAIAIFPGGFGTLDELFETLTLIQTGRMARMPVLLFAPEFWSKIVNFEALRDAGTISPGDLDILNMVETADEAWSVIRDFYALQDA